MNGEVVALDACKHCEASIEANAKFCAQCGKRVKRVAAIDGQQSNLQDAATEFVKGTVAEAKIISADALRSDVGKKIAAGAALGAVAGAVVPFVGPAIGATLVAGYVALKRLTK